MIPVKRHVESQAAKRNRSSRRVSVTMSQNSKIEWTEATWNPVRGFSRISPGCENCCVETTAARFSDLQQP